MKLFGTYPSHFTRKVRIALEEFNATYDFIELTDVWSKDLKLFAFNPLLRFPVFVDDARTIFESENIMRYIYAKNKETYLDENQQDYWENLNRLAVINGAMGAEVRYLRAKRTGVEKPEMVACFQKDLQSIEDSLHWLDASFASYVIPEDKVLPPTLIALVCFLDHIVFREFIGTIDKFANLKKISEKLSSRKSISKTHPEADRNV